MCPLEFETRVCNWIEEQKLISPGDIVVMGVSGGADSVALLRFFERTKERLKVELLCVHVEHGIRGDSSLQDAAFVERLCEQLKVSFRQFSVGQQIEENSEQHMSLEEKARKVRYEVLLSEVERLRQETGRSVKLAVAHHGGDNVETMLFHLARGTGIDGMRGMPVKRGAIIRPFLSESRNSIEDYLEKLQQDFCTDDTNMDVKYHRNYLRHKVIPEIEKINPQAVPHMNQTAFLLGQMADYIGVQVKEILHQATIESDAADALGVLKIEIIKSQVDFMQREVLHMWLQQYIPGAKDIGAIHMEALMDLMDAQVGRTIHLPGNMRVWRVYDGLAIGPRMMDLDEESWENTCVKIDHLVYGEEKEIAWGNYKVAIRIFPWDAKLEIPRNSYTKWFDYDKMEQYIQIRHRRSNDYLQVLSTGGKKKLQDYFVNEKISASRRDEIPLVCVDSHVMWVVGYRISEYYKIKDTTKIVLEVRFLEEKENE